MTINDLDAAHRRTAESGVDLDARRECHLYRIDTWNHEAFIRGRRVRELGYVGESAREPLTRLGEHLGETSGGHLGEIAGQPWADLYCGQAVDDRVYWSKRDVVAAERVAVEAERPRYNVEFNGGNRDRTPPWQAIEERHERDRLAGRPLWVPPRGRAMPARPAARAAAAPRAARARAAAPARRAEPLRRNRWPWRLGTWAAVSLLLWAAGVIWLPMPGHLLALPSAAGTASVAVGTCWRWRNRRGWRRQTCKGWATVLAFVAVVAMLHAGATVS